ncbi:MAG: sulfatase family protein [Akkermansiaceae bacterium]
MKYFQNLIHLVFAATVLSAAEKPNIVFVLFDDMGYGEPVCYRSNSKLKTPNLDRLATQGMRFTDSHSASSVCTPTRYGLLTGRYPSRNGQYGVLTSYDPPIIPPSRMTVASLLQQHGYDTACIGKWHLGLKWDLKEKISGSPPIGTRITQGPNQLGFDFFYGFTHARDIGSIIEQDKVVEHVMETANQPKMIAKAVEWLKKRDTNKPFFLYFPMCPPHTPIVPSKEFTGKSGAVDEVKKDPKYGDWVFQGDHMLGQILETLDQKGVAQNTLVIVTADNGASGRPYAPLRAAKTSIYEGGHRVPFVVRWPGKIASGSLCDHTICHNDLIATCADLLGAKLPADAGEDSVSLLPLMLGSAKNYKREATIHQSASGDLAIRKGDWKMVFLKNGSRELYHLKNDIGETQNISQANPEIVRELTSLMKRYANEGRSTPGDAQPTSAMHMDPERLGNKSGATKHQKKKP